MIGYLVSLGTNSTTYKATAQVYLGQPLAPGAATPVTSAPTSLGLVSDLVDERGDVVRRVAAKVGLKPGRLRGHITTKPIVGITQAGSARRRRCSRSPSRAQLRGRSRQPRTSSATIVVDQVSSYADVKIQALHDQLAFDERELKAVVARIGQQSQAAVGPCSAQSRPEREREADRLASTSTTS